MLSIRSGKPLLKMSRYRHNHLAYLYSICLVLFFGIVEVPADQKKYEDQSVHMVWAEPSEQEYAIFYSVKNASDWSAPVKISANDHLNVAPAITIDPAGMTWVVWSVVEGSEIHLYYRRFHDNSWGREAKIDTGLKSNTSPTLLIDGSGTVWLAWAGLALFVISTK